MANSGTGSNLGEPNSSPFLFGEALRAELKEIVQEAVHEALSTDGKGQVDLLTPEELADRLKIPLSWVYEQSRQGNIPTHRLGRYIRFDLHEVLSSQKIK